MLIINQAITGTEVIYKDPITGTLQNCTIEGIYTDENIGLMIKSSLYPGGMPAERYFPLDEPAEMAEILPEEALPAVTFELTILEKKEPVKLTAALITSESKVLTDLTIKNYLDEAGYKAVKAAKQKAIKTRTAIEKKEEEVLKAIKSRHADEIKEVKDYTSKLYIACRAVENDLAGKLTTIDTEKAAEAKKLADAELAKTTGRENKMYEWGLTFNGTSFVGYGKTFFTKNSLYSLSDEAYDALLAELEGLQFEQSVSGEVKAAPVVSYSVPTSYPPITTSNSFENAISISAGTVYVYPTALYDRTLPDGTRIVLTKGEIVDPEAGAKVVNDRVGITAVYVQVI